MVRRQTRALMSYPMRDAGNLLIGVSSEGERVVLRLDGELTDIDPL